MIILEKLMHRVYVETEGKAPRKDQTPKPCDHFDIICGTGTGGLIAIMLGRLRLDLETCEKVYSEMTRKVFETDKTIAGIPYRSTLFKASKLEEAIMECVREYTVYIEEGNDNAEAPNKPPKKEPTSPVNGRMPQRHLSNASVLSFSHRSPSSYTNTSSIAAVSARERADRARWANPNAKLYDHRENRTKTLVTAIYKGTRTGGSPALLRSYDSRKEPSPEYDCTIWEAGRATSATGLAFKPIQVGQSVFLDEGAGQYNPAPFVLDEACVNEWPGREVGVFVSIGTGKRPAGSDNNQHLWYEGFMGEFAEARRRLISKIEGCEDTHQYMVKEGLSKRGVNIENYYRLNVEIGVGEFGMNEYNRLNDISMNTHDYLKKPKVEWMAFEAATKLAKIHRAHERFERDGDVYRSSGYYKDFTDVPEANPMAVELPADFSYPQQPSHSPPPRPSYESYSSGHHDTLEVPGQYKPSPRTSSENNSLQSPKTSNLSVNLRPDDERFLINNPTPLQYRTAGGADKIAIMSMDEFPKPPPVPQVAPPREAPPIPPKTPIQDPGTGIPLGRARPPLPYPLDDGPPPPVNMARKPEYKGR
jgi:hypothetical protein